MNLDYPSTKDIPLFGRIERFGSVAALVLELAQSGAIGILKIGKLEFHLNHRKVIYAYHPGMDTQGAAVAILQMECGSYRFFAQDPVQCIELDIYSLAFAAMQALDETRHKTAQSALVILPTLQTALEYVRGLGTLKGWNVKFLRQYGLLLERRPFQILVRGVTLIEYLRLMPTLQNTSSA